MDSKYFDTFTFICLDTCYETKQRKEYHLEKMYYVVFQYNANDILKFFFHVLSNDVGESRMSYNHNWKHKIDAA